MSLLNNIIAVNAVCGAFRFCVKFTSSDPSPRVTSRTYILHIFCITLYMTILLYIPCIHNAIQCTARKRHNRLWRPNGPE